MSSVHRGNIFEYYPRLTLVAIVAILLISLLYAAEKYLESKHEAKPYKQRYIRLREPIPSLDIFVEPNADLVAGSDSLISKKFRYRTDENAYIMPSQKHEKPDLSFVFLGGSTTECMYVEENNRFPYLVGVLLEKSLGRTVNSYNAGFAGNHSLHSLDVFINKVIPLKPDYAVMMHNINDLTIFMMDGDYWRENYSRGLIVVEEKGLKPDFKSAVIAIKDALFPEIYRLVWINGVSRYFHEKDQSDEWKHKRGSRIELHEVEWLQKFRSSLQSFVAICRSWHIEPVLMTQANRFREKPDPAIAKTMHEVFELGYGISYKNYSGVYEKMNQVIRDVAKENKVLLIDLEEHVPKDKQYMYDSVHLNDDGSRLVASIIADSLKPIVMKKIYSSK